MVGLSQGASGYSWCMECGAKPIYNLFWDTYSSVAGLVQLVFLLKEGYISGHMYGLAG
jgi:hypothetical protein